MACGVFHKASKASFWHKVKGLAGRIGSGIKNAAVKTYNFLSNNREAIQQGAAAAANMFGGKYADGINKGVDMFNKGMGYADKAKGFIDNISK